MYFSHLSRLAADDQAFDGLYDLPEYEPLDVDEPFPGDDKNKLLEEVEKTIFSF